MERQPETDSLLGPYRVLDLTEGGSLLCGKIFADMGADVIVIERPGGSPSRNIGPFYKDIPHPEKSLFWFAYNVNKRGITLDIEPPDGQELFKKLARTADFVIESFPPKHMDKLGLGYKALSQINPRIIVTSITPFGQTGPYARYKSSDLTCWAMGGFMYLTGFPDRPPNWISVPQAFLNTAAEAASGSLMAHWHRELTGEGQQVDVSVQQSIVILTNNAPPWWDLAGANVKRAGNTWVTPTHIRRQGWQCKDGYVTAMPWGGDAAVVASSRALVEWMDEEGMAPDWLKEFKWETDYDASKVTQETVDRIEEPFIKFFLTKTKQELFARAVERGIFLAPSNTTKDILEDSHLAAREFWVKVDHPELGDQITYTGPTVKFSETPCQVRRRPPLIGEHNEEIYQGELGLSTEELILLKQARVI